MKRPDQVFPSNAVAWLRLAEGDSRFPVQAIPPGDFLIGSGSECDMCLGDGILPPLHSVIRVTAATASWTAMVRDPALVVNGEVVRHSVLSDGDLVEVGPFRMTFRLLTARADRELQALLRHEQNWAVQFETLHQQETAELVNALQQQLVLLDQMDRTTVSNVTELLRAAAEAEAQHVQTSMSIPTEACQQLCSQIVQQSEKLDSLSEVLQHVIQQQRVMTGVIHSLTEHVTRLSQLPTSFRKAG